jgi:hypothetical protein
MHYRFEYDALAVPWKCPACVTPIRQELNAAGHDAPKPQHVYRCSVCHLELILSEDASEMIVAPLEPHRPEHHPKHK